MNTIRVLGGPGTEAESFPKDDRVKWLGAAITAIDLLLQVRTHKVDVVLLRSSLGEAPVSQILDEYPDLKVLVIGPDADVELFHRSPSKSRLGKWTSAAAIHLIQQAFTIDGVGEKHAIH